MIHAYRSNHFRRLRSVWLVLTAMLLSMTWYGAVHAQTRCIGRVVDGQTEEAASDTAFEITAAEGAELSVTITRLSGDLSPFIALRYLMTITENPFLARRDADDDDARLLDYSYPEPLLAGDYLLIVSRYDVEHGDTQGDYLIEITGVQVNEDPRCYADSSPPPSFDPPGIILDTSQYPEGGQMIGSITNRDYLRHYLIYLEAAQTIEATVRRDEDADGDLLPLVGIVDADNNVISGTVQQTATESVVATTFTAQRAGWYAIAVSRFDVEEGKTEGRYHLTWVLP